MSYSCPLSFENIDSNVSRFNSLFVSLLLIAYLYSFNIVIVYFLLFELSMRLFIKKDATILHKVSKSMKAIFKLKDKPTDSGAKRLAGYFAILFLILLLIGNSLNIYAFSLVVACIFFICSLMDAFFNFCIGCKIYFIIKKKYPNFMS